MKLFADRPFEEVLDGLYLDLDNIADSYLADKNVDLVELSDSVREISLDDEYGPMSTHNAIERTFRAALIHIDKAKQSRQQGDSETAWARLVWAARFIGRIQRAEAIETAAKRQAELTSDLKVKVIELVSCMRPEGGWSTHEEAFAAIEADLLEYRDSIIDDEKRKDDKRRKDDKDLDVDLIQQMRRWRKDDHFVRAAFAGNSAKVIAERAKVVGK